MSKPSVKRKSRRQRRDQTDTQAPPQTTKGTTLEADHKGDMETPAPINSNVSVVQLQPTQPSVPVESTGPLTRASQFAALRPQQKRRLLLALSFLVFVLIPGLLSAGYFLVLASDRYSSTVGFAVRGMDGSAGGGDFLGALTGLTNIGTTTTDSYILLNYLTSREVVERLIHDISITEKFSRPEIDFLYRVNPDETIEKLVDYWSWMVSTSYDNTSSIIEVEVQAFNPKDAKNIAELILQYSSNLVNKLSKDARKDAVQFAKEELSRAELRLRIIRERMLKFRVTKNSLDPTRNAEVQMNLVAELERELISLRSRISTLRGTIDENSPSMRQLRRQEAALLEQITLKRTSLPEETESTRGLFLNESSDDSKKLPNLLANYEELIIEQQFAQGAYTAALSGLEQSRIEADRQQRYLAVFQAPSPAQEAEYPRRVVNTLLIFITLLAVWTLGVLIVYSIRDHLR
ncbi:lipopolysaccharide biosynthesis protein [Flexibacterium corallicola]|uniref:lipopolysaccharide biosynthesis protein n=1 Tax=Flexibacterium corallicola TaxID=3037259 RepID=UPI00286F9984|nr:lipopolysaccharide biosynthesis protein [Pseudovibrio sp. M1P-2-3]